MVATTMPRDGESVKLPVFTTVRVQAVTQDTAWTPGADDRAFSAPEAFASLIITSPSGAQHTIPLEANVPRGIIQGYTYTFGASGYIEVM